MILGGLGVVALVIFLLTSGGGGGGGGEDESNDQSNRQPPQQSQPPTPSANMSSAQGGKAPGRPAPPLSQETLSKVRQLLAEAKTMSDDGIRLRKSGDNKGCRAKQSAAKVKIDQIKSMIETQSLWQEEAEMGDWAQPAEYVTLARIYVKIGTTEKTIRMQGGK
jgi:hypothetical protein